MRRARRARGVAAWNSSGREAVLRRVPVGVRPGQKRKPASSRRVARASMAAAQARARSRYLESRVPSNMARVPSRGAAKAAYWAATSGVAEATVQASRVGRFWASRSSKKAAYLAGAGATEAVPPADLTVVVRASVAEGASVTVTWVWGTWAVGAG